MDVDDDDDDDDDNGQGHGPRDSDNEDDLMMYPEALDLSSFVMLEGGMQVAIAMNLIPGMTSATFVLENGDGLFFVVM